jgi:hypothetical protein
MIGSIVSAVFLLAIAGTGALMALAWQYAGYEPDTVISLPSGLHPLAVTSDGATLIAGTLGEYNRFIGPIRFLDLTTGKDSQAPLALKEIKEMPEYLDLSLAQAERNKTGLTLKLIKEMADSSRLTYAGLSADDRRFVVLRDVGGLYVLTVFDLSTRAILLNKTFLFGFDNYDRPQVQISPDGSLLAVADRAATSGTVWDVNTGKERFLLPGRSRVATFQFSPDSKLLAWFSVNGFQLSDTATGAVAHSFTWDDVSAPHSPPTFSPDSKLVAADDYHGGIVRVFDTATGKACFESPKSTAPQFLPDGSLRTIRDSGGPTWGDDFFVPEIVVWDSKNWTEKRGFVCSLGANLLSGTVIPQPWATGSANQSAVAKVCGPALPPGQEPTTAGTDWQRWLGLNVPRGLELDVFDYATGDTKTYHLDGGILSAPRAGKSLVTQSGNAISVWSIPPHKSNRAVKMTGAILAAVAVMACVLIVVVRLVRRAARWFRARQQSGPPLSVQL